MKGCPWTEGVRGQPFLFCESSRAVKKNSYGRKIEKSPGIRHFY